MQARAIINSSSKRPPPDQSGYHCHHLIPANSKTTPCKLKHVLINSIVILVSHKMTWCKPMSKSHGLATARVSALCEHVMMSHLFAIYRHKPEILWS